MAERNTVTEANSPDNAPPQPLLDDEQLDRLDDFLDSEQVGEDALDLISAHGFLVALAVAPSEQPTEQWLEELFQGEPNYRDAAEREEIIQLLTLLRDNTMAVLEQGGLPELPFELTLDGLPAELVDLMDNVVVLTGDIHTSWAIDLSTNPYDDETYDPDSGAGALAVEFVTPAVTSGAGYWPELMKPGINGERFETGNVEDLKRVLRPLLADPTALKELGETAREDVVAHHSIRGEVAGIHAMYDAVLSGKNKRQ